MILPAMTTDPRIDAYLATLPEPQQRALRAVRAELHRLVPDAEEPIGYGMPVVKPADLLEELVKARLADLA